MGTAATDAQIVEAVARVEWYRQHGGADCRAHLIPTPAALVEWLPDCPAEVLALPDSDRYLSIYSDARWVVDASNALGATWNASMPTVRLTVVGAEGRRSENKAGTRRPPVRVGPVPLQTMHADWLEVRADDPDMADLRHPLAPLVAAWQKRPQPHLTGRANRMYEFFQSAGAGVRILGQCDSSTGYMDMVVDLDDPALAKSFGLAGSVLVRCFQADPCPIHLGAVSRFLRNLGPGGEVDLHSGEHIVLNPTLAFAAVPSERAVHHEAMRILADHDEVIVPLDDEFVRETQDPLRGVQDTLGQFLGQRDVYDTTFPVSGRRFFGRERLLIQLTEAIQQGQFIGIYGLRKIGKTSLVYQLRDEKLRHDAVAYVDLQASAALATRNCSPLYWELERDLYLRLSGSNHQLADLLRLGRKGRFSDLPANGAEANLTFAEDMRSLLDVLASGDDSGIQRVVILLDELERILPVTGQHGVDGYLEFFGLLRGLAQTERYRGLLSCAVVAANAALSDRGYWEQRENPFFALYKPFFLAPLAHTECVEMISDLGKGMTVYWDEDATSSVFSETGGHPFLTRSLCSHIVRQHRKRPLRVTARMVHDDIGPFLRDEGHKLEQITELLKTSFPDEHSFLQRVALEEDHGQTTDQTVRHLLGYQLITAQNGGYRLTLNLLRRWLRRRAGIAE